MTFVEWCEQTGRAYLVDDAGAKAAWDAATAAEREACAKVCESLLDPEIESNTAYADQVADSYIQRCADLIRAR